MDLLTKHRIFIILIILFGVLLVVILVNTLVVIFSGKAVPAPTIPREEAKLGSGPELRYLILGDSTTIAQGSDYEDGYVVHTSENLSKDYEVSYRNYGVSGAVTKDVLTLQLPNIKDFKPDIVLVAVGANDVTHLTSTGSIKQDAQSIITQLKKLNREVKIVFTGSASMGDVKRFPWPTSWLARLRTSQVNKSFLEVIESNDNVSFAYIARETGEQFAQNPQYFAEDNFHPNAQGYAVWTEVLNREIQRALAN
jgi:lysophospholipase L1-like esterase